MYNNEFEKDTPWDDLHEECGVFGMYDFDGGDVASTIYYGLFALQHRGQESCGIAVSETEGPKGKVTSHKGMGLVNEVFAQDNLEPMKGDIGVGHVRYSTAGASTRENAQPLVLNYVKGTLLSSFLVFILTSIMFYIFNLNGALLLGFICGITNIIPFIGPYIGAVIPILIGFTKGSTFGILIMITIFIIQAIEGNIIHPIIMSKSINIHPVTVIISLLVFGYFFGVVGMVIASPLIAILKELYFYLIKKYNSYKRSISR